MIRLIAVLALLIPLHAHANDKLLHFAGSAAIAGVTYALTDSTRAALLVGLGVGLAKELRDRRRTGFSTRDIAADALGVGAGIGFVYVIRF